MLLPLLIRGPISHSRKCRSIRRILNALCGSCRRYVYISSNSRGSNAMGAYFIPPTSSLLLSLYLTISPCHILSGFLSPSLSLLFSLTLPLSYSTLLTYYSVFLTVPRILSFTLPMAPSHRLILHLSLSPSYSPLTPSPSRAPSFLHVSPSYSLSRFSLAQVGIVNT